MECWNDGRMKYGARGEEWKDGHVVKPSAILEEWIQRHISVNFVSPAFQNSTIALKVAPYGLRKCTACPSFQTTLPAHEIIAQYFEAVPNLLPDIV